MSALIEFDNVCKYYQMGDTTVKAADHISMKIASDCAALVVTDEPQEGPIEED